MNLKWNRTLFSRILSNIHTFNLFKHSAISLVFFFSTVSGLKIKAALTRSPAASASAARENHGGPWRESSGAGTRPATYFAAAVSRLVGEHVVINFGDWWLPGDESAAVVDFAGCQVQGRVHRWKEGKKRSQLLESAGRRVGRRLQPSIKGRGVNPPLPSLQKAVDKLFLFSCTLPDPDVEQTSVQEFTQKVAVFEMNLKIHVCVCCSVILLWRISFSDSL